MKRLLLLAILALSACAPATVNIPATAAVAIRLTDAAMPTNTIAPTATPATPTQTPTPAPSPTPTLGVGASKTRSLDSMVMMYVPAGEFTMGYDQGNADEQPVHTVNLDAFWIDNTEVTTGMYAVCVTAGMCRHLDSIQSLADSPVVNADWQDANTYCSFAGSRLPTEAEWEKAARGTDGRIYPWGMDMDKTKVTAATRDRVLPPVGSSPNGASPYGVVDMAGSTVEWVADWYSGSYYAESPSDNPTGPRSGSAHVIRGGWWQGCLWDSKGCPASSVYRSTFRNHFNAYGRIYMGEAKASIYFPGAGFRCAQGSQP